MKSLISSNSERTKINKTLFSLLDRVPCTFIIYWNFCVSCKKNSLCTLLREFIFISNQDMLKKSEDNRKSGSPDDISPDQEGPVQQGFPRGQVYYASSAKQVRILQTSSKINAKRSWCRMYLARIFFYRICYFVDKWCAKYCLFWHCQILFHWIYVSNGIYDRLVTLKCSSVVVYVYPLWRIFSSLLEALWR